VVCCLAGRLSAALADRFNFLGQRTELSIVVSVLGSFCLIESVCRGGLLQKSLRACLGLLSGLFGLEWDWFLLESAAGLVGSFG
jgi:hypothetical protein